jgi:predicted ArsR family transcriptional regulator
MAPRGIFVNIQDYKVAKASGRSRSDTMIQADSTSGGTRERILTLLLHSPTPVSTPALAALLGISRNATHVHMSGLERDGLVERAEQISTRGRPSRGFRLSAAGKAFFPRQYALLARNLLAELARHLGPEALPGAMARIGEGIAAQLEPRVAGGAATTDSIAALMRELGYEARPSGDEEIEAHNCVFHDLAMRDTAVCAVDLALLGKLSGRTVEHRTCMARGERSCRFGFGPREDPVNTRPS